MTSHEVPHSHRTIVRAGGELVVGRTEADRSNGLLVRLEHFHVVHVALPVLHVARVIASHHPGIVSTPDHRANSGVVCLQNRLEVERQTVPQGELATAGSGYQSSTLGCPQDAEERTAVLVGGRTDELGGHTVHRIVQYGEGRQKLCGGRAWFE